MNAMFYHAENFNDDISAWDTLQCLPAMSYMFAEALKQFNQPIENWNTYQVTNMHSMFSNAYAFNQDIEYGIHPWLLICIIYFMLEILIRI